MSTRMIKNINITNMYIVHYVAMVASFDGEWMVEERRLAVTLTSTGNLYS